MRKPSAAAVLAVLLAATWTGLLVRSPQAQQPAAAPQPQAWEYKAIVDVNNPPAGIFLAEEGRKGWEVFQVVHGSGGKAVHYYLKRPKR